MREREGGMDEGERWREAGGRGLVVNTLITSHTVLKHGGQNEERKKEGGMDGRWKGEEEGGRQA